MNKIVYSCLILYLAATTLIAQPVKSNVGGNKVKNISNAQQNYTAADYVQDGLIILIDGIENAGWGIHDPNAKPTDLISLKSGNLFIGPAAIWTENSLTNGCYYFNYAILPNIMDQIPNAKDVYSEMYIMLKESKQIPISARWLIKNMEMVDAELCQVSINRYEAYWNVATRGISKGDDGQWCTWVYTPNFQYMTKHTITIGYDNANSLSFLYCDGQFIKQLMMRTYTLSNVQPNQCTFYFAWAGWNPGYDLHCYRMYNRKLTDAEIKWNHKVDKVRFGQ